MTLPRYMTLTDSEETDYLLPDTDRVPKPKLIHFGSISRSPFTGALNEQTRATKHEWTLSYSALPVDAADDGGIGYEDMKALAAAGETYTLTLNEYEGATPETFTVRLDPTTFPWVPTPHSGRKRFSGDLIIREV